MLFRIALLSTIPLLFAYKLESGKEFDSSRYSDHGEKGESGYVGHQQSEKGARGRHDKEDHQKQYAEREGHRRGYNHKDGYYGDHHQGEKGSKGYHFEDHGRYAKGHSTKGHHNIHKLDEYKKNTDFFNEDDDQAFEERHGGYEATKGVARGGHNAGGHFKKAFLEGRYGLAGFADKGTHYFDNKGHKKATGQDGYYGHHAQFAQNGGQDGFKKFGYAKLNAQ